MVYVNFLSSCRQLLKKILGQVHLWKPCEFCFLDIELFDQRVSFSRRLELKLTSEFELLGGCKSARL